MVDPDIRTTAVSDESLPTHDEIRRVEVPTPAGLVELTDDPYSDRIRCDHPDVTGGEDLPEALLDAAESLGRGRIVALVDARMTSQFEDAGFSVEAIMPGFYHGEHDCAVVGAADEGQRMDSADLAAAQVTESVLARKRHSAGLALAINTELATTEDAAEIAELLDDTFTEYPTPSGDPEYVAEQLREGTVFRVVRRDNSIVACASADLVRSARTAELTDCATRHAHRGRGYMRAILTNLMEDLVEMDYPTAFTLSRLHAPASPASTSLSSDAASSCEAGCRSPAESARGLRT